MLDSTLTRCYNFRTKVREIGEQRPKVNGKFLYLNDRKFLIRGVTYGPFGPAGCEQEYGGRQQVERDFGRMQELGINTVRTYTLPPGWVFDLAAQQGLYLLVGLAWEQHVTFLDHRKRASGIERSIRRAVSENAGRPALLGYAIGNEIPSSIVRWYGPERVRRFLRRLYRAGKSADPDALFTYVNYPTTEYLQLPFLDFLSFNVYLESQERLSAYIRRLQNQAGNSPLVLAELGLDSRRNGEKAQSSILAEQIQRAFSGGCAGAVVFSWTDRWHRGGMQIEDWDFGLTRRDGSAKPALRQVSAAFQQTGSNGFRPHFSVVVCVYNGERTIRQCLESIRRLDYPNYEIIVVDDGSRDFTPEIVGEFVHRFQIRYIRTENQGLSAARNVGLEHARGQIIAYIDSDAYPDPDWLTFLAAEFGQSEHAAVGGPNIPAPGTGLISDCVAHAPGGPVHVLLTDRIAEHIPGCNMAFRKERLEAIGGFDARFRSAGDDVDVCWRLQQQGWTIGFSPAAVVFHHYRSGIRAYWRQQKGYGRAETLLEHKWPEKYNDLGHVHWHGMIYNGDASRLGRHRIYHGVWGAGLFQSIYQPAPGIWRALPLTPEWYLIAATLGFLTLLTGLWNPLFLSLPILAAGTAFPVFWALRSAFRSSFRMHTLSGPKRWVFVVLTTFLHLLQPLARLRGRLGRGIRPWFRGRRRLALPFKRTRMLWNDHWQPAEQILRQLHASLQNRDVVVSTGSGFDRWDLEVRMGVIGSARIRMALEEHGQGKQLIRLQSWPRWSTVGLLLIAVFALLSVVAMWDGSTVAGAVLGVMAGLIGLRAFLESAAATGAWLQVLKSDPRRVTRN